MNDGKARREERNVTGMKYPHTEFNKDVKGNSVSFYMKKPPSQPKSVVDINRVLEETSFELKMKRKVCCRRKNEEGMTTAEAVVGK